MRADERQLKARKQLLRKTALRSRCPSGRKKYPSVEKAQEMLARIADLTGRAVNAEAKGCWLCGGAHVKALPTCGDKPRKPLPARSAKTAKIYRLQRVPLVTRLLAERPVCEIRSPVCTGNATTVHEVLKRSRGGSITDEANCVTACAPCNQWVEDNPREAHHLGFAHHSWERTR